MKGFASIAIAAMAIALVAAYASIGAAASSASGSMLLSADAQNVAYRHFDSSDYLSNATMDALLDSAYSVCGCGADSPQSFNATIAANITSYFSNASVLLSGGSVSSNYSRLWLPSVSVVSCNSVFPVSLNYTLSTNSSASRKQSFKSDSFTVGIESTPAFISINATRNGFLALNVTVTC